MRCTQTESITGMIYSMSVKHFTPSPQVIATPSRGHDLEWGIS